MTPFEKFKKTYQGKKVLVVGLGLLGGGVGVAKIFAQIGAQVTVTDLKSKQDLAVSLQKLKDFPVKFVLGHHQDQDFNNSDLIVRNPAVASDSPFLRIAQEKGIPIIMEASLFAQFCDRPIIGVTGTRGKTTTATLITELLKSAGKNVLLGGNIKGRATLELFKKIGKNSIIVLELSSWELAGFNQVKISPRIALITNIFPDHLNRYKNMEDYVKDKKFIFKYQKKTDYLVLNRENRWTRKMAGETKSKVIWFSKKDLPEDWQIKLPGIHNRENVAAAWRIGQILGLSEQTMKFVFANFKGVKFRLEEVKQIKGVKFINDTTSTIPEATLVALKTIDRPVILLAGGASKNLDLTQLAKAIVKKTKAVVLLSGTATKKLTSLINQTGGKDKILGEFNDLGQAVLSAWKVAKKGDVILLSPGCASFGLFQNEYHRGKEFNQIVKNLTA